MYCMVRSVSSSIETARGSVTVESFRSTSSVAIPCMPRMLARVRPVGPAPTTTTCIASAPTSAAHDRGAPQVQRALLVPPGARRARCVAHLEVRRDLEEVPVRILHHEEDVVARAVPPDAPVDRDARGSHAVGPRD